jgi:hypothetical protein
VRCLLCDSDLQNGEERRYENLEDHVCYPNRKDFPLRPTFVCPNSNCKTFKKLFYDEVGYLYFHSNERSVLDELRSTNKYGSCSAYDSHAYRLDIIHYYEANKKVLFHTKNWKITVRFRVDVNENNRVRFKGVRFSTLKRDGNIWIYHISNIRMFFYAINSARRIIQDMKNADMMNQKEGVKYSKKLLAEKTEVPSWADKKEWYRKASSIVIKKLYSKYLEDN